MCYVMQAHRPKLASCAQVGNIVSQLLARSNRLLHELSLESGSGAVHAEKV